MTFCQNLSGSSGFAHLLLEIIASCFFKVYIKENDWENALLIRKKLWRKGNTLAQDNIWHSSRLNADVAHTALQKSLWQFC